MFGLFNDRLPFILINKFSLFLKNNFNKIIIYPLTLAFIFVIGFLAGEKNQFKFIDAAVNRQRDLEKEISFLNESMITIKKEYEDELNAVINDKAQLLSYTKEAYKRDDYPMYSPLLEEKNVEIRVYKYRGKEIINRQIRINDYLGVEIWEKVKLGDKDSVLIDQVWNEYVPGLSMDEISSDWTESYITKNGDEMFYDYDFAKVYLSSHHKYFHNHRESEPSLVRIWYNREGHWDDITLTESRPSVSQAKNEINKVADTLIFGFPDQNL